jgi:cytochrome c-type protein NapC
MPESIAKLPLLAGLSLASLLVGLCAAPAARAAGIDWASVPGKDVVLFYPGQSAWEWALTPDSMSGATKFMREGKSCVDCHDGEEKTMGDHLVSGKPRVFKDGTKPSIEPTPIAGKPGWIGATVKFANDGTNLYVHLDVKTGNQPNAGQDAAADTKVTVMFSAAKTPDVLRAGCFAACHNDMTGMPDANGAARTHYLGATHAKLSLQGGGDALKPDADLSKLKAANYFLEDWQAKLNPGRPAQAASYVVFAKRDPATVPLTAQASYAGGIWSVTLSSKLAPGGGLIDFATGTTYAVSFAVHAGHTDGRFHYVSLEKTLVIDSGNADFVAVKK